jgi:hypothetical protein
MSSPVGASPAPFGFGRTLTRGRAQFVLGVTAAGSRYVRTDFATEDARAGSGRHAPGGAELGALRLRAGVAVTACAADVVTGRALVCYDGGFCRLYDWSRVRSDPLAALTRPLAEWQGHSTTVTSVSTVSVRWGVPLVGSDDTGVPHSGLTTEPSVLAAAARRVFFVSCAGFEVVLWSFDGIRLGVLDATMTQTVDTFQLGASLAAASRERPAGMVAKEPALFAMTSLPGAAAAAGAGAPPSLVVAGAAPSPMRRAASWRAEGAGRTGSPSRKDASALRTTASLSARLSAQLAGRRDEDPLVAAAARVREGLTRLRADGGGVGSSGGSSGGTGEGGGGRSPRARRGGDGGGGGGSGGRAAPSARYAYLRDTWAVPPPVVVRTLDGMASDLFDVHTLVTVDASTARELLEESDDESTESEEEALADALASATQHTAGSARTAAARALMARVSRLRAGRDHDNAAVVSAALDPALPFARDARVQRALQGLRQSEAARVGGLLVTDAFGRAPGGRRGSREWEGFVASGSVGPPTAPAASAPAAASPRPWTASPRTTRAGAGGGSSTTVDAAPLATFDVPRDAAPVPSRARVPFEYLGAGRWRRLPINHSRNHEDWDASRRLTQASHLQRELHELKLATVDVYRRVAAAPQTARE